MYYMFGFLFLVFLILIITCSEATILLCYFHLCAEVGLSVYCSCKWWFQHIRQCRRLPWTDFKIGLRPESVCRRLPPKFVDMILWHFTQDYHWWWRSFMTSGFTGVYFFIYCVHYFVSKLEISGFVSTLLYFGYTFIMVFVFCLLTGKPTSNKF